MLGLELFDERESAAHSPPYSLRSDFMALKDQIAKGKGTTCSKSCASKCKTIRNQKGEANGNWKGGITQQPNWKYRRMKETRPDRLRVWRVTKTAILNGTLKKQPCEVCGEMKVDAHHDDYSKPLSVRWLCRKHHLAHHRKFNRDGTLKQVTNHQDGAMS